MNQEKLYADRIKNLEREIRQIKTAHYKTATTINTMAANVATSFSLVLDQLSGSIYSSQRAIITMSALDNTNMISACYLVGINPDNYANRFVIIKRLQSSTGQAKYEAIVISQNPDDFNTLIGGGTVNLNYTLQLVGSSRFSASVSYRAITGGSS